MEVHLSPDTETQLEQFAASEGKDVAHVIEEAITRMLKRRAQFLEGVERGITAADRGELIDHADVVKRIDRLLAS